MKKVFGLCLVLCLSSSSLFANESFQSDKQKARCERMIKELNLNEKQADEFREIHFEYSEKIREKHKEMLMKRKETKEKLREMRNEKNDEMKKIMTDEQYKRYQKIMEKQMKKKRNTAHK